MEPAGLPGEPSPTVAVRRGVALRLRQDDRAGQPVRAALDVLCKQGFHLEAGHVIARLPKLHSHCRW